MNADQTYLLLPALKLLDQKVISLRDFAKLGIHATLQIDEILPGLERVPRVLIALSDNLVQMPHGDLGHEGLLLRSTKDGLDSRVTSLSRGVISNMKQVGNLKTALKNHSYHFLADMIHDRHDRILIPPFRILDGLYLSTHHDDLARGHKLSAAIG